MNYKEEYRIIAQKNGFQFNDDRTEVRTFGSDNGNMVRREFCEITKGDYTYFAYDTFAPKTYMSNIYSGVYVDLGDESLDVEFSVLKKVNMLLNFLLCGRQKHCGVKFIDDNVDIKTNNMDTVCRYLNEDMIKNYLEVWERISPIKIVAGLGDELLLPVVSRFSGRTVIGIQANTWIKPEELIEVMEMFIEILSKLKR